MKYIHDEVQFLELVATSKSYREVVLKMGLSGGSAWHAIKQKISELQIDVSHFLGQGTNSGINHKGGPTKFTIHNIHLVKRRVAGWHLTKIMLESGIKHKCFVCDLADTWMGKKLMLQVDHVDGNGSNNALSNLRFLCPNCHSQTETFGFKGRKHTPETRAIQSLKASKPRKVKSYVTVAKLADASDRESDA